MNDSDNLISMDTIFCRNDKRFLANKMGEELVMMDLETGEFYAINTVGSEIWSISATPVSVSSVVSYLRQVYNVTDELSERETVDFLTRIAAKQMIIVE